MTTFRLRRNSFYIRARRFVGVGPQGAPKYAPCVEKVRGEVFTYLGRECGIYKAEHTKVRTRKYDYITVDLASGLEICRGSRKLYVLTTLEGEVYASRLQEIFKKDHYAQHVEEFKKLKGDAINGKDKAKV